MEGNSNKRFQDDHAYRIYRIKYLGKKYGWKFLSEIDVLVFGNDEAILSIDPEKLTIETSLVHPTKGETKLIRSGDFTQNLIERIFRNPRAHMPAKIESKYAPKE